jgi:hypothetical protein
MVFGCCLVLDMVFELFEWDAVVAVAVLVSGWVQVVDKLAVLVLAAGKLVVLVVVLVAV